ncbi:hypothetical protein CAC42_6014 [Sphaceloma murrayae]|uniref:tRNA pseudouridine(55) synthase n=1 Tax=Sphaceloma murrayae TaxID=2082308 RepID=A0A2K1QV81_9PEZI|nr:hypothetical protein CAC42_6014 [Sphaceloma murrayae]
MSTGTQVLDGVFAVNKPKGMTSAHVCDEIKHKLTASALFAPAVQSLRDRKDEYRRQGQKLTRKMRMSGSVKIGHGGTLDPMASGVISFGVGEGTKALNFLQKGAEKGYEAVVLFGAATDSFDAEGKVVGRKGWDGVTREAVEAKLEEFRGKVFQRPSVYSALSRGGVRMYEYAREGKEIPELEKREMFVTKLELVDWMEGGTHEWKWPDQEIENDRKEAFVKTLRFDEIGGVDVVKGSDQKGVAEEHPSQGKLKRKRGANGSSKDQDEVKKTKIDKSDEHTNTKTPTPVAELITGDAALQDSGPRPDAQVANAEEIGAIASLSKTTTVDDVNDGGPTGDSQSAAPETTALDAGPTQLPCPAPAARIRMVVSSGFYVRSLCHDLGVAAGSLAIMTSLKRTKQACFELDDNVLDYEDFDQDEAVWGQKVARELNAWPARFEALQARKEV